MSLHGIILCFSLFLVVLSEAAPLEPLDDLRECYYCAVCIPIKLEKKDLIKYGIEDLYEKDGIQICELKPLRTFWGSGKRAQPSLLLHPVMNMNSEFLVLLRDEKRAVPGEWYKKFVPISKAKFAKDYLLGGDEKISRTILISSLERASKELLERFPLDE